MLSFAIGRDVFKERVVLNKTVLGMFEQYPRASFCIYEQTDFSDSLKASFEKNILPKLKGKNNKSGHYQPSIKQTNNFEVILRRAGAGDMIKGSRLTGYKWNNSVPKAVETRTIE
jgi:hypothetical protein